MLTQSSLDHSIAEIGDTSSVEALHFNGVFSVRFKIRQQVVADSCSDQCDVFEVFSRVKRLIKNVKPFYR